MWIRFIPFLFLLACATAQNPNTSKDTETNVRLHDIWALVAMDGEEIPTDLQKYPTLEIFIKDRKALGNDGCNSFSGSIKKISDTELVFGPLLSTKMACTQMDFSKQFNTRMSATQFYRFEKIELVLMDGMNKEILRFKKVD